MFWALLIILLISGFVVGPGETMSNLFAGLLFFFGAFTLGYLCEFPPHRTDKTIIQIVGTILWWFFCFRRSGLIPV